MAKIKDPFHNDVNKCTILKNNTVIKATSKYSFLIFVIVILIYSAVATLQRRTSVSQTSQSSDPCVDSSHVEPELVEMIRSEEALHLLP